MAIKIDNKTTSKPKTATTKKITKPATKSPAIRKDSSILIKAAETVGGILGTVAGTITSATGASAPAKTTSKKTAAKKSTTTKPKAKTTKAKK